MKEKLNVVWILSDQHAHDALGCYGHRQVRDACFSELRERIMVRTERWKLARYEADDWMLFDMFADPDEDRNLYAEMQDRDEIAELRRRLLAWRG